MPAVISSTAGTRTEPKDGYVFLSGTTVTFKMTILNNGVPTTVDSATQPFITILQPTRLNSTSANLPQVITQINGSLVPGQEFEYQFQWTIPPTVIPDDEYVVMYQGVLGSISMTFADEYFTITNVPGQVDGAFPSYATVTDVRMKKFNIDSFLPEIYAKDLNARNNVINYHLTDAGIRLREELSLFKTRGNSANYRLFCIYYAIWTILLAARGEDGSSVSDSNLATWQAEWMRVLAQEKREGVMQGIPLGRG